MDHLASQPLDNFVEQQMESVEDMRIRAARIVSQGHTKDVAVSESETRADDVVEVEKEDVQDEAADSAGEASHG